MRKPLRLVCAASMALAMSACGSEPHIYPQEARTAFNEHCPAGEALCECIWENMTQHIPYDEYEAAIERYRVEGLMDRRISRARTECRERHHS